MPRFSGSTASPSLSASTSTVSATDWPACASLPASASALWEVQWLSPSSSSATARIRLSAS